MARDASIEQCWRYSRIAPTAADESFFRPAALDDVFSVSSPSPLPDARLEVFPRSRRASERVARGGSDSDASPGRAARARPGRVARASGSHPPTSALRR